MGIGVPAKAKEMTRVISREHPAFDIARSRLAVGRDGRVYLASDHFVLGMEPDGSRKIGGVVTDSLWMAAANADGVIATANAHFNHSVNLWGRDLQPVGGVSDFLVSDEVEFRSPTDVEVGESGDFYGLDPNRRRIVRVAAPGRAVTTYSFERIAETTIRKAYQLRVWERGRRFYVASESGAVYAFTLAGTVLWTLQTSLRFPYDTYGWRGGLDVDEEGRLFVLSDGDDTVQIYDPGGKAAGGLHLHMGERRGRVSDLRVFGDKVFVKRPDPTELFQVYDRPSGTFRYAVLADAEIFKVSIATDVWTAGTAVPASVQALPSGRPPPARWRAWIRPLGVPEFEELPFHDGLVTPPASASGIYQVRISPDVQGRSSEYEFDSTVEIVAPSSRGSVSIYTSGNRLYFGQGEIIPISVVARRSDSSGSPLRIPIELLYEGHSIAEREIEIRGNAASQIDLSPSLTRALRSGRYWVSARAPGFSVAPQPLEIGPGIEEPPAFSVVQHGDYAASFPTAGLFDTPEKVEAILSRAQKLGINMFVDRLGHDGRGVLRLVDQMLTAQDLLPMLRSDPRAISSEKARIEGPVRESIAGYGAYGIEQRGILLSMDAGLPLGTGYDKRTPDQLGEVVRHVTSSLLPYPAFRGWSWAANWWVQRLGAAAAEGGAEAAAYSLALTRAETTGAWDPVLDQVSDRMLGAAALAERQLNAVLQSVAPGKLSVMTGPYRADAIVPPVAFRNADEVDLHYQAEQIQPPEVTPENVDFYKRPGKRAWGHPEIWNDDGTGAMLLPTLLQMVMRGADGVGWSGEQPYASGDSDPRAAGPGEVSVVRALGQLLHEYGPWLTTMHAADRVAIVVSPRMMRIQHWGSAMGDYFAHLYEAYGACLYAHRPASFVFAEDLTPKTLHAFSAVLVVGQRVELEPNLSAALTDARSRGTSTFYDSTSRPEVLAGLTALGIGFDHVARDPSVWQDDSAYRRIPAYFETDARTLRRVLDPYVAPVADVDDAEILLTERVSGQGRFVWVIDNIIPDLDPGLAWRTGLIMSTRLPLDTPVTLNRTEGTVYDVFAQRELHPKNGVVDADLRTLPARLFAILPRPIAAVEATAPATVDAGASFDWSMVVRDDLRQPLSCSLPVRVALVAGDGSLIREEIGSSSVAGRTSGRWIMPINPPAGAVALQVSELISGKTARVPLRVRIASRPENLLRGAIPHVDTARGATTSATGRATDATADGPIEERFGPHLKDVAVSMDEDVAVFNAMNWDQNLYAVDLRTGQLRWERRLGHHFSYDPQSIAGGFAVQAFDRMSAEGYHLYLLERSGAPERRFALYGLPKRATNWAISLYPADRIDQFAVSPAGDWVASAGDLGLVVWRRDGRRLWSADEWKSGERRTTLLAALDRETLVGVQGATVTGYNAISGTPRWTLRLAATGNARGIAVGAPDSKSLAVWTDSDGGRVFLIRDGTLLTVFPSSADSMVLSPDGETLAVTTGTSLKWYAQSGTLLWSLTGDDVLRHPAISADGQRIAVGSEIGTLYVVGAAGQTLWEHDCQALPVAHWLTGGDLLIGTWMGQVQRFDESYRELWHTHLASTTGDVRPTLLAPDATPTTGVRSWGNSAPVSAPLVPNLLTQTHALISATMNDRRQPWQNPIVALTDGKPDAPPLPWLPWTSINYVDSGWFGHLNFEVDTIHTQIRLRGITFVEDAAHPESWLRDVQLQFWDSRDERWADGPCLLSNTPTHTHWLDRPIEAARFRFVTTGGGPWPAGNIRLGELVFHGEVLGGSHPDVAARRPIAFLFDEQADDFRTMLRGAAHPFAIAYGDAYSGGKALVLTTAGSTAPADEPPFGRALPNWDFEIEEHPRPGQYRWIQFAWKALSPQTTGMSLLLGRPRPAGAYAFVAGGQTWPAEGVLATERVTATPPLSWQVVRADLWALHRRSVRIQDLSLAATGGGAAFDQIVLGRTEADLDRVTRAAR
jgi:outer membrane protein assembly factor BamB